MMKKTTAALLAFALLFACAISYAETGDESVSLALSAGAASSGRDTSPESLTDEEDTALVSAATDALKDYWKALYIECDYSKTGYLEIKNTRIIWIQDEPKGGEGVAGNADSYIEECFEGVDCVVEFVLFSDYYGSDPYYCDAGIADCVVVYADGTMAVSMMNLFYLYRSRTFSADFSGIIREIVDFGAEYNCADRLLEE